MSKQSKSEPPAEGAAAAGPSPEPPLNVILSLAPEDAAFEEPELLPPTIELPPMVDLPPTIELPPTLPMLRETDPAAPRSGAFAAPRRAAARLGRGIEGLGRWLAPPRLWLVALGLALLFLALVVTAWSSSAAGVIFPDWGLASLRIGMVAAALGIVALLLYGFLWQTRARPLPVAGGVLGVVLVLVGAGGIVGAAPGHRLQGLWFEGRGAYGLALAAYQASGDSLARSQAMARISIEWAEQLSARHQYQEAVSQLEPVVRLYKGDAALETRARKDVIQDLLAWGDQSRQQGAFRDALAHYQTLHEAAFCDAPCQSQAHAETALALLGLAQQLTTNKQYDQAVATYQQLVQSYGDTPQAEAANSALTTPQALSGTLVSGNGVPAKQFQMLLASSWSFNASTHVFTLSGQQYQVKTDASGVFVVPAVAVGMTYLLAWIDTAGHGGTCLTTNNQPLYTVKMQPLRAAEVGTINIECA